MLHMALLPAQYGLLQDDTSMQHEAAELHLSIVHSCWTAVQSTHLDDLCMPIANALHHAGTDSFMHSILACVDAYYQVALSLVQQTAQSITSVIH